MSDAAVRRLPSSGTMLRRGLTKRCPRCGAGKLFRRWTRMVDTCPGCDHRFEREEGFFLGAVVINAILTEGSLLLFIAIGFGMTLPHPPLVKLAVIAGVLGLLAPIVVYPFTKTTWSAVDFIMRRSLGESYSNRFGRQHGYTPSKRDR